jgi:hypothetical protein
VRGSGLRESAPTAWRRPRDVTWPAHCRRRGHRTWPPAGHPGVYLRLGMENCGRTNWRKPERRQALRLGRQAGSATRFRVPVARLFWVDRCSSARRVGLGPLVEPGTVIAEAHSDPAIREANYFRTSAIRDSTADRADADTGGRREFSQR